jgi:hypothetical protein
MMRILSIAVIDSGDDAKRLEAVERATARYQGRSD